MSSSVQVDVAIIGGGPAGSTVGTLLKKYNPYLNVLILEREKFPRDHVGESQLPFISRVLEEMEVWDQVEAAGFPIKIGATYRWGKSDQLWDFEFIRDGQFDPVQRPSSYVGQRLETAFQVDRAIYDEILLNHTASVGCDVRQETEVLEVLHEGDRVTGLRIRGTGADAEEILVEARHYVDCSGYAGCLRKTLGINVEEPTLLKNIAIWDYWQDAEWPVTLGIEGTRIQILSLGYGWLWFIPLGNGRTSVGLVVPARYYKERGVRPAQLYKEALSNDKIVTHLLRNATQEDTLRSTKDWSFLAERVAGKNWFIAGEAAGFADPILSAGMSLAHKNARDVAYSILELDRGEIDAKWLKEQYDTSTRRGITQHIRFADFWYSQNGQFSDLKDYAREISQDAGLNMTSEEAWRWLGTGGFIDNTSQTDVAGFAFFITKNITASFLEEDVDYKIFGYTHFRLDLVGAKEAWIANYHEGKIHRSPCYVRGDKQLPMLGICGFLAHGLSQERSAGQIIGAVEKFRSDPANMSREDAENVPRMVIETLEALVLDGWVIGRAIEGFRPWPKFNLSYEQFMHENRDVSQLLSENV
ncbi:MAG TPA: NAD(P)/FAD-dependent oxidoreductase [Fimbriimonas sp.]|nr:NAD(P)/FAD-dependent oxidoreductase [Fimbriimonas sp.]